MTKTKRLNSSPTMAKIRGKMVLKELQKQVGKGGKPNLSKAMQAVGYTESYAESGNVLKKKSWNQLMEQYLPDELLARTHNQLLNSKEIRQLNFNYTISDEEIQELIESQGNVFISTKRFMTTATVFFSAPNDNIRHKASELGYKVKGKMAPETLNLQDNRLEKLSTEEVEALIAKKKAMFNKTD